MPNWFGGGQDGSGAFGMSGDAWQGIADAFQGAALIHQPGGAANLRYLQQMQEDRYRRRKEMQAERQRLTQDAASIALMRGFASEDSGGAAMPAQARTTLMGQAMGPQQQLAAEMARRQPKTMSLSPGETVGEMGPNGFNPQYTAPKAETEREPDRTLVEIADPNDPTRGIFVPRAEAIGRPAPQTIRERMPRVKTYYDEDGNPLTLDANDPEDQSRIRGLGLTDRSPSGEERTARGFLDRMRAAEPNLQKLVDSGYDPANLRDKSMRGLGTVGNYGVSDQGQLYRQAEEDWVRAKLRKESGAVIADEEMTREIQTYFPQPGDTKEVQEQKRISRKQAERQLAISSGILGRKYLRSEPPAAALPQGVTAEDWADMTPEERALFQ